MQVMGICKRPSFFFSSPQVFKERSPMPAFPFGLNLLESSSSPLECQPENTRQFLEVTSNWTHVKRNPMMLTDSETVL